MAKSFFESIDEAYATLPQASNTAVSNLRMALQDNLGDWRATRDAMQQANIELAKNVPTALVGDTDNPIGSFLNTQIALGAGAADARARDERRGRREVLGGAVEDHRPRARASRPPQGGREDPLPRRRRPTTQDHLGADVVRTGEREGLLQRRLHERP